MKEELDFAQAPYEYALCLNWECPKASNCFRQRLENIAPADVEYWKVISPKYQANITGECPYYRPYSKVRYAKGFMSALNRQPYRATGAIIYELKSHFGTRTYYRIRKGERMLSPNEQDYIQRVFKKYGGEIEIQFDAYQDEFNW